MLRRHILYYPGIWGIRLWSWAVSKFDWSEFNTFYCGGKFKINRVMVLFLFASSGGYLFLFYILNIVRYPNILSNWIMLCEIVIIVSYFLLMASSRLESVNVYEIQMRSRLQILSSVKYITEERHLTLIFKCMCMMVTRRQMVSRNILDSWSDKGLFTDFGIVITCK